MEGRHRSSGSGGPRGVRRAWCEPRQSRRRGILAEPRRLDVLEIEGRWLDLRSGRPLLERARDERGRAGLGLVLRGGLELVTLVGRLDRVVLEVRGLVGAISTRVLGDDLVIDAGERLGRLGLRRRLESPGLVGGRVASHRPENLALLVGDLLGARAVAAPQLEVVADGVVQHPHRAAS